MVAVLVGSPTEWGFERGPVVAVRGDSRVAGRSAV